MAKVSAIVSAYFAEKYINGRLANLADQIPRPEIVVVAKKDSVEAAAARKFPTVLIVTDDVPTLYDAWNMGIRFSSGEYITNANSDDILWPGGLSVMADTLDEHPEIALCYADSDVVLEYGKDPVNRMCWVAGGLEEIKQTCFIGSMPMWRKSLHAKYGYFDKVMKSAGDYEFWLRIMIAGEKIHHIPQALGAYLDRPDSIFHKRVLLSIWEVSRARSRYIKELQGA